MYAYRISKKYAKEGEMNMEKDVVKEEKVKELFINEKSYQQLKKKMCKTDDYFSLEELKKYTNNGKYF